MGATAPEGKTFQERWPADAAEAGWLAGPWVIPAVGGVLGVLTVPLVLASIVLGQPLVALVLAALAAAGVVLGRREGPLRRPGRWLYHLAALALGLAGLGIVTWVASLALFAAVCPDGCTVAGGDVETPLVVVQVGLVAASVLGSIVIAFVVARAGRRWVHPPVARDLEAEAWTERRHSHPGAKD